jgi:hypothetical protein
MVYLMHLNDFYEFGSVETRKNIEILEKFDTRKVLEYTHRVILDPLRIFLFDRKIYRIDTDFFQKKFVGSKSYPVIVKKRKNWVIFFYLCRNKGCLSFLIVDAFLVILAIFTKSITSQ